MVGHKKYGLQRVKRILLVLAITVSALVAPGLSWGRHERYSEYEKEVASASSALSNGTTATIYVLSYRNPSYSYMEANLSLFDSGVKICSSSLTISQFEIDLDGAYLLASPRAGSGTCSSSIVVQLSWAKAIQPPDVVADPIFYTDCNPFWACDKSHYLVDLGLRTKERNSADVTGTVGEAEVTASSDAYLEHEKQQRFIRV